MHDNQQDSEETMPVDSLLLHAPPAAEMALQLQLLYLAAIDFAARIAAVSYTSRILEHQLETASGTRYLRAYTDLDVILGLEKFVLKTMIFCDVTTVLNERAQLKMVIRSVPGSVALILGQTERQGLTT